MEGKRKSWIFCYPAGDIRPTTVFWVSPDPRREVAMIFQALRNMASAVPLGSSMHSGLLDIMYSVHNG